LKDPSGLEPVSFSSISFPFEKLTGQRLIYASLGTLQNRKWEIFQTIAEACLGNDAQIVISLGNPNIQDFALDLPGSPLVVPYAPHQQLIEKATLVITHAGMNTTLAALSSGVPLVAIPITNEQPGIASRVSRGFLQTECPPVTRYYSSGRRCDSRCGYYRTSGFYGSAC
jgi:UDP:flavonoid glycosyltransferase YjiC (YdhE family)